MFTVTLENVYIVTDTIVPQLSRGRARLLEIEVFLARLKSYSIITFLNPRASISM